MYEFQSLPRSLRRADSLLRVAGATGLCATAGVFFGSSPPHAVWSFLRGGGVRNGLRNGPRDVLIELQLLLRFARADVQGGQRESGLSKTPRKRVVTR